MLNLAFLLFNFSQALIWTYLRIHIYDLRGSFLEIVSVSAIPSLLGFIFSSFWGMLSDRVGSRKIFIFTGIFLNALLTPLYVVYQSPEQMLIIYTASSFFSVMIAPSLNALISSSSERRGGAIGRFWTYALTGSTLGTLLGGFIIDMFGYKLMYILASLTSFVASALTILLKEEKFASLEKSFRGILSYFAKFEVFRSRNLRFLILSVFIQSFAGSLFYNLFFIKLYILTEENKKVFGLVNSLAGFPSIFASRIYGELSDRIGRKRILVLTSFAYSPYFIILTSVENIYIVAFLWALPLWPGVQIPAIALATELSTQTRVGESQGLLQSASSLGIIIGSLSGGLLGDILEGIRNISNIQPVLYATAIFPIISGILAMKINSS